MKKNILVCGLIAGLIVIWWMIAAMAGIINRYFESGMLLGYATMLVAFSLIFVGIKNYRDNNSDGVVTFGRAFKIGLLISLVASTIYVVVWMIYYYNFVPDFYERYSAGIIRRMQSSEASAAAIQKQMAQNQIDGKMYRNPIFCAMFTYLEILPVGIIVSLLAAAILKRKPGAPNMVPIV